MCLYFSSIHSVDVTVNLVPNVNELSLPRKLIMLGSYRYFNLFFGKNVFINSRKSAAQTCTSTLFHKQKSLEMFNGFFHFLQEQEPNNGTLF